MDISQLIQTLVATVVGGLIVIATNWISVQEARRNTVQEWYEKTYVTEGIDPMVTYFLNLSLYIYNEGVGGFVRVKDIDVVPVEAMTKLLILFNDDTIPNLIAQAHKQLANQDKHLNFQTASILSDVSTLLLAFRKELLKTIAVNVRTKHYVVDTSQFVEKLKKKLDELEKLSVRNIPFP